MQVVVSYVNVSFTAIFIFEAVIKVFALRCMYFKDLWNIFDFVIVLASITTISLDLSGTAKSVKVGSSTSVIRTFRIAKVLRLIKRSKSLRHIFKTFIASIKPLTNIGSLLLLILYIYAIAGVQLFGQVKRNGFLNDSVNFESFYNAALTLFVVATGDSWTEIATSALARKSVSFKCISKPTY